MSCFWPRTVTRDVAWCGVFSTEFRRRKVEWSRLFCSENTGCGCLYATVWLCDTVLFSCSQRPMFCWGKSEAGSVKWANVFKFRDGQRGAKRRFSRTSNRGFTCKYGRQLSRNERLLALDTVRAMKVVYYGRLKRRTGLFLICSAEGVATAAGWHGLDPLLASLHPWRLGSRRRLPASAWTI